MAYIEELFSDHFIQYASYVIRDRAIPLLGDGLKPVQRRILQSLWDMDDGKFHKVANVVGHCMQYHPHGDSSIYGALVNLANKDLFIEKQGNFGNIYTGDPASAARYIECRLSPLARRSLFNPEVTEYLPSYDGRRQEPIAFPAKLPFLLILGAEGIAVGMSTRILPHNLGEVITAMCAELKGEPFELLPDFPTGGLLDVSPYNAGNGKVLVRARLECEGNQIVIRELPYGVTTESLIASLEAAAKKGRIRAQTIQNFTAEQVEIVLQLPRGTRAEEQIEALYAFTDCEVSISCNLLTIDDKRPVELETSTVLRYGCENLKKILQLELELEAEQLRQQIFSRKLERIFIEDRLYSGIEKLKKLADIENSISIALEPYCAADGELGRPVHKNELAALLQIPIRRISLYDIERMQKELRELDKRLRQIQNHLKHLTKYALSYLQDLLQEFVSPRRTELASFGKTNVRQAAQRDQMLYYDEQEGFLGYQLKEGRELLACSPYDRVLLLKGNGTYSVCDVPGKLFVGKDLVFCHLADKEELAKLECALIYRDEKASFGKRFQFGGYILGKEYRIMPEHCQLLCFYAVNRDLDEYLETLRAKLRQIDAGPNSEKLLKEREHCHVNIRRVLDLPPQLAQAAENIAAFVLQFAAESKGKKPLPAQSWYCRFSNLPQKTVKARGQILRKQRAKTVKLVSQAKLKKLESKKLESSSKELFPQKAEDPAEDPVKDPAQNRALQKKDPSSKLSQETKETKETKNLENRNGEPEDGTLF